MSFTKEQAKEKILQLVRNCINNKDKLKNISERDTRVKFIDRTLEALGWDVFGAKIPDEVQREESVKFKGPKLKKVDYTLKINSIPRIMIEAKALNEDLEREEYEKQAIEYAYNKACSWAVLTNFKTVKIFYVDRETISPFYSIRIEDIDNFNNNFEDLWLLSKENVEKNALDYEVKRRGIKKDKIPVDQQLFSDLRRWRELLSKDIQKRYSGRYDADTIDEIVQRIIDRIIFIRKSEDSELEERKLDQLTRRFNKNTYNELKKIFLEYNEKYDSELFGKNKNSIHETDKIEISNDVIEDVIRSTYKPKGSRIEYNFDVIDADILGNIYEQYLAFILTKTPKKAKLKGGKTHRKEQGIYYTPTYIVDYVVRNTLGELLKNKNVNVEKIRVLDPACGSGSFLIKAFDILNEYYSKNDKNYDQKTLAEDGTTYSIKERILKNNIFGVDLDKQAIQIAQLNLLLKIAETGHRLPLLRKNIKCGNSLIDDSTVAEDSAFKWEEKFNRIMNEDGFDIVIGNPPYGATFSNSEKKFIKIRYKSAKGRYDSYYYFIEKGISVLKNGGYLGFIVPDTWLTNVQTEELRKLILCYCSIINVVDLPQSVFPDANVDTCIIILKKEREESKRIKNLIKIKILDKDANLRDLLEEKFIRKSLVEQKQWIESDRKLFNIYLTASGAIVINRIKYNSIKLGEITGMCRGINPYAKSELIKKYGKKKGEEIVKNRIWHSEKKENDDYKKELIGSDIGPYRIRWKSGKWIKYGKWLSRSRDPKFFKLPHLVIQRIRNPKLKTRLVATFVNPEDKFYNNSGLTNVISSTSEYSLKYVLAIINSKLMNWYYKQFFRDVNIKPEDLRELPIKKISLSQQQSLINFVDKILSLNEQLNKIGDKKIDKKAKIEQEIKNTDKEIDEFIYKIYGIKEKEKKIIEESFNS